MFYYKSNELIQFFRHSVITVWSYTAPSSKLEDFITVYNNVSLCILLFMHIPGKKQDRITQESKLSLNATALYS